MDTGGHFYIETQVCCQNYLAPLRELDEQGFTRPAIISWNDNEVVCTGLAWGWGVGGSVPERPLKKGLDIIYPLRYCN